jgi:hypothetical protein
MRRRRPIQTAQTNIRLDTALIAELEARARANRTNFSEEIRARLIDSLEAKAKPGLARDLDGFKRQMRDAAETFAREEDMNIEDVWDVLRKVDSLTAQFYAAIETELSSFVRSAAVRELLRGAPTSPNETAPKPKATQQD